MDGLSFLGGNMFSLKDKLTFININQDYLKYLHEQCPEVYYKPINYDNKPYLGILITNDGQEYVVPISSAKKKHKKMIPVKEGLYTRVDLVHSDTDSEEIRNYKNLMNKEFAFCLKLIRILIKKANKIYEKQMSTGKVVKYCCDFKLLEEKCRAYEIK